MSLSALNSPLLVSSIGIGAFATLPKLQEAMSNGTIPFHVIKMMNVVAYGLNVYATSQPGRIDSAAAAGAKAVEGADEMARLSTGSRGKTLLAPAGWAFAIWGPIFLGELVFAGSQLATDESDPVAPVLKSVSGPFIMSQLFQVLWAASFRPKYKGKLMFISTAMLSGIAFSLSKAHAAYSKDRESYTFTQYLMYFLPMSLHFGWTSAASLVNLNGAFVEEDVMGTSAKMIASIGHFSALLATAAGVEITRTRSAPVYGAVISWALAAVSSGMKTRVQETTKVADPNSVGVYGAKTQQLICVVGSLVSAAYSIYTATTVKSS